MLYDVYDTEATTNVLYDVEYDTEANSAILYVEYNTEANSAVSYDVEYDTEANSIKTHKKLIRTPILAGRYKSSVQIPFSRDRQIVH